METLTEHKAQYAADCDIVENNIASIRTEGHAESCKKLINNFHKKYGPVSHYQANHFYGMVAGFQLSAVQMKKITGSNFETSVRVEALETTLVELLQSAFVPNVVANEIAKKFNLIIY